MPGRRSNNAGRRTGSATLPAVERFCLSLATGLVLLLLLQAFQAGAAEDEAIVAGEVLSIESVRLTAGGHFVDLRYRVKDAVKANELLDSRVKPRLIDEKTGTVMEVPMTAKLGSLRQTQAEQKTGRVYFVLFSNATLRPGSVVTAELGALRFEGLRVE